MSLRDYKKAIALGGDTAATFEALIMAALRNGSYGSEEIRLAFPHIEREFNYRYWSGGGLMPGEPGYDPGTDDNLPVSS